MNLDGAVCIITGSAIGIGADTAERLARRGCRTVINYTHNPQDAERTVAACRAAGSEAIALEADVASDVQCRGLAQAALDRWGRIDALVNNAGITKFAFDHRDLDALQAEDFARIFAVNVTGAFQMARAVVPAMRARGEGAIVNVSSLAGLMGTGSSMAYAASKGALNTLTLSLARVLGPQIRVNAVCPGFVATPRLRDGLAERYEAARAAYAEGTALGEVLEPEDVSDAVIWLLAGARRVTGEILTLDAGLRVGRAG